jgi:hypothetical protein
LFGLSIATILGLKLLAKPELLVDGPYLWADIFFLLSS